MVKTDLKVAQKAMPVTNKSIRTKLRFVGCIGFLPDSVSNLAKEIVYLKAWSGNKYDSSAGGQERCSKTVVVLCSEPCRLDQNGANQVAGKWLRNQLE
jgi:hypothetical protein